MLVFFKHLSVWNLEMDLIMTCRYKILLIYHQNFTLIKASEQYSI